MKRTITAKGKSGEGAIKEMSVRVDLNYQWLTVAEAKKRTEQVKNSLNDFLRVHGSFNQSEIKIS